MITHLGCMDCGQVHETIMSPATYALRKEAGIMLCDHCHNPLVDVTPQKRNPAWPPKDILVKELEGEPVLWDCWDVCAI